MGVDVRWFVFLKAKTEEATLRATPFLKTIVVLDRFEFGGKWRKCLVQCFNNSILFIFSTKILRKMLNKVARFNNLAGF